jgi:hypothetical protein
MNFKPVVTGYAPLPQRSQVGETGAWVADTSVSAPARSLKGHTQPKLSEGLSGRSVVGGLGTWVPSVRFEPLEVSQTEDVDPGTGPGMTA